MNYGINRGSFRSPHVLLNFLHELGKQIRCEACPAFQLFFATRVGFYLSYDIKINLKDDANDAESTKKQ